MTSFGLLFALANIGLLLFLPKQWAPLPFLLAATYITLGQKFEIAGLSFTVIRLLIAVGLLRVIIRGERISGGLNGLDRIVLLWGLWLICTSAFHESSVLALRLGESFTQVGIYFLLRVFIGGLEEIRIVFRMICVLFVPLAATMLVEKFKGVNPLGLLGFGLSSDVTITRSHFRASGAFSHPILAGTAGAVCVPIALYFWRGERKLAVAGLLAALSIVYASGSSGPIMTAFSVIAALALWMIRDNLRAILWLVVLILIVLAVAMNDPIYYLMARIDITGGSTGYFRAQLIRSAIEHINEWWLVGTDYTRHWMPTGIPANEQHTDITNYYLQMGVWGGLGLMLLFIGVLAAAFQRVGKALKASEGAPFEQGFLAWTLGSILFGHAIAFTSISYYDQTVVFLYLILACIGGLDPTLMGHPDADAIQSGQIESDVETGAPMV